MYRAISATHGAPVVVVNLTGSLSDIKAFGWQFITQHQILPTAQYPGVQVPTFMDRDGPLQPARPDGARRSPRRTPRAARRRP